MCATAGYPPGRYPRLTGGPRVHPDNRTPGQLRVDLGQALLYRCEVLERQEDEELAAAASRMDRAGSAPAATRSVARLSVRFHTVTSCPLRSRRYATALPMAPVPITATLAADFSIPPMARSSDLNLA
ncbi:hypothetical protein GCM10029963_07540 [Micromonospora andamanensis]